MNAISMLRRAFNVVSLATVVAALPASAQTNPRPETNPPAPQAWAIPATLEIKDDLEIENGILAHAKYSGLEAPTVGNIVKILHRKYPDVNVVLAPEVSDLTVQDMKLHQADLLEEFEALRVASGGMFVVRLVNPDNGGAPLIAIEPSGRRLEKKSIAAQVEIFNLTGYLEHKASSVQGQGSHDEKAAAISTWAIDQIQQTISETVDSLHLSDSQLNLKFHQGTGLLVVTGSPEALNVAAQVINVIITAAPADNARDAEMDKLKAEIQTLKSEIARIQANAAASPH